VGLLQRDWGGLLALALIAAALIADRLGLLERRDR
jgi:hypothetical protein